MSEVKIRNSKFEIRNKSEIGKKKIRSAQRPLVLNFLLFCILICFVFRISNFGFAATPPATKPADQIAIWFSDLANRDATVRANARIGLMGIKRDELPILRNLVEKNRPLAPSQSAALHEIVAHVYLAGQTYPPVPARSGFLGVKFSTSPFQALDVNDDNEQTGVVVAERMPGFCAFPLLQNGDVIVGVTEAPDKRIRTSLDLVNIIGSTSAGDTIHLQVLRGGEEIQVRITLDARPNWTAPPVQPFVQPMPPLVGPGPRTSDDEFRERERISEEYWEKEFAPLLEDGVV